MTYVWYGSYKAAILETDWTKIQRQLQTAEQAIYKRERVLTMDRGGSVEEREAMSDALRGISRLGAEVRDWQKRQLFGSALWTQN